MTTTGAGTEVSEAEANLMEDMRETILEEGDAWKTCATFHAVFMNDRMHVESYSDIPREDAIVLRDTINRWLQVTPVHRDGEP